ncbi:MAG: methionine synthase, partial [Chloroflexi bacterium]|nr:methionine synthase [Chloroflexota bacterium]
RQRLQGQPDMTQDPEIQQRKEELKAETMTLVAAIRELSADGAANPLLDVETLARAVELGLLDAPQLRGNPHACGQVRARMVNGANQAVDERGSVLPESERIARLFPQGA